MPPKIKVDDLVEALTDPKVVQALTTMLAPCIKTCLREELDQLKLTLGKVEVAYAEQEKLITSLQSENKQLKRRIDSLDTISRQTSLVIRGLPESSYAEKATGGGDRSVSSSLGGLNAKQHAASTEKSVLDLCKTDLGLDLCSKDIEVSYRLRSQNTGAPRPILVTFASRKIRNEVYERRRVLKGKVGAKVYICENLTASVSEIVREARQLVKDKRLHSCWTSGGSVVVKRTEAGKPSVVHDHISLIACC